VLELKVAGSNPACWCICGFCGKMLKKGGGCSGRCWPTQR